MDGEETDRCSGTGERDRASRSAPLFLRPDPGLRVKVTRALLRRPAFDLAYLREKYADLESVPGNVHLSLRDGLDLLLRFMRYLTRPVHILQELKVDR